MDVQDAPAELAHEVRTQDAHETCEHNERHARLFERRAELFLELLARRTRFAIDTMMRDACLCRAFQGLRLGFVRQHDGDLSANLALLLRLDDGFEVRAAPRAQDAKNFLTHREPRL